MSRQCTPLRQQADYRTGDVVFEQGYATPKAGLGFTDDIPALLSIPARAPTALSERGQYYGNAGNPGYGYPF